MSVVQGFRPTSLVKIVPAVEGGARNANLFQRPPRRQGGLLDEPNDRAGLPLQCGSYLPPRSAAASRDGCSSRLVSPVLSPARLSVSSSLLERATMSQKSSLPQPTQSVSRVLTAHIQELLRNRGPLFATAIEERLFAVLRPVCSIARAVPPDPLAHDLDRLVPVAHQR